jgi:hypothetical protein
MFRGRFLTFVVFVSMVMALVPLSLCALARSYAAKTGIGDSLCAKLDSAAAARDRGNVKAAQNILKAFANEVEAQRGKAIASENADTLIALAGSL